MKYSLAFFFTFLNLTIYGQNIFFGDLHVHSDLSWDGHVNIDTLYNNAINIAKLDFICVTDHDLYSNNNSWIISKQKANFYNLPGKFVALIGYEYTHLPSQGGHLITYTYKDNFSRFSSGIYSEDFLFKLVKENDGIIHIAHSDFGPYGSNINIYDGSIEKNIEIIGYNGFNFEYFGNENPPILQSKGNSVQDYLGQKRILGFMGVTDNHYGDPGKTGLTGVYADSLTRLDIFNAIKNRHVFATNGQKIRLLFKSNNFLMGDSILIDNNDVKKFSVQVSGTDIIKNIEVIKNGIILKQYYPNSVEFNIDFIDSDNLDYSYYYIKVIQNNGGKAWSSPLYFLTESLSVTNYTINAKNILSLQAYPNPSTGLFNLIVKNNELLPLSINVFNILGQKIISENFSNYTNFNYHKLDLNKHPNGTYFIRVQIGSNIRFLKINLLK